MRKLLFSVAILGLAGAAAYVALRPSLNMIASQAQLSAMADGSYMAALTLTNDGSAQEIVGVSSPGFDHAHFMGAEGAVVVPGGARPSLAGDGVHVMLMGGTPEADTLVPLELTFASGATLSLRAKVSDMAMSHGAVNGIEVGDVSIALGPRPDAFGDGFRVEVQFDGIELVSVPMGAPHVAGQGHAHVYLNGLKLQRLYTDEFSVGPLLAGDYVLRVALNSNAHTPYVKDGLAIEDVWRFTVD